ncbi:putative hydro-lyase [Litoreibacter meonggei]|uniref:putative hydro-lyase n=1 Tax=Litoreibacter meonggei TaxID=1049199 RepID=UPI000EB12D71|nr:putative hydro-lyase [Litoreibacter meonggei]
MLSDTISYDSLRGATAADVRKAIRSGAYSKHTAGLAAGKLQCNLAILPEAYALDFLRFCQRNPKPCPVVGVSETGSPYVPTLGSEIDIRTDVPQYRVYRDGVLAEELDDISDIWRDDLVTIALGCSFTFENALIEAGINIRHIEQNRTVPMYSSSLELVPAGPFHGTMVVTMRPIPYDRVADALKISAAYPQAHGAPVASGDPAAIGIANLNAPEWGEPVEVRAGELPLYWACGVTPQNVLLDAKLPFVITHKPGCMLIADVGERDELSNHTSLTSVQQGDYHYA